MSQKYSLNDSNKVNSLMSYNLDVEDIEIENSTIGTCGLANEHAWCCYMNSILQCISNLKIFRDYIIKIENWFPLFSNKFKNEMNIPDDPTIILNDSKSLFFQIYRLLNVIWKTSDETYDARSFQNLFLEKNPLFARGIQQDSHETLQKFLEIFHDELSVNCKNFINKNKSPNFEKINSLIKENNIFPNEITDEINHYINNNFDEFTNVIVFRCIQNHYQKNNYSILSDLFGGFQSNELLCPITNKKRILVESFYMLTLPIPIDDTIDEETDSDSEEININKNTLDLESKNIEILETKKTDDLESKDTLNDDLFIDDDSADDIDLYNSDNYYNPYYQNINHDSFFDKNDKVSMNFREKKIKKKKKILNEYSLFDCFDLFTKSDILDDDNKWNSPFAKTKVNAVQKINIWEPPKILIIGLKRNEVKLINVNNNFTYSNTKKENKITFPIYNFNIKDYMNPLKKTYNDSKYNYNLKCINNHSGNTENGHYWSYCKNSIDNKWYNFNDDNVSEISEENIVTKNAYILFYIRSDID